MPQKQKQKGKQILAPAWHALSAKDVLRLVKSRPGGLTDEEVGEHARLFGRNELPQTEVAPFWHFIFSQLASPLVYVLLAAAAISAAVGDKVEVVVILAAVAINTGVGFWQEYKADRALQKLTSLLRHYVTVERDGREQKIESAQVVVGDVVLLHAGDRISADARILEEHRLQVNEASLTGESVGVDKHTEVLPVDITVGDRRNMVFAGTIVTQGTARAVVVAVGQDTELGEIAAMVHKTGQDLTPLQVQLRSLSRALTVIILLAALSLYAIGLLYGISTGELLVLVAALAVAAIPEGLLVSLTLVLVIGMQRLLRKRGLVRKLVAAETLGSVTVVCSDKTGTLTKGVMQVARIVVHGEQHEHNHAPAEEELLYEEQHLFVMKGAMLCNDAYIRNPQDELRDWEMVGDQTDAALLLAGVQAGFERDKLAQEYLRLDEVPFDERYKFMATLHHVGPDEHIVFAKGAPEAILDMCSSALAVGKKQRMTPKLMAQLREEYHQLAQQGLRVLAVASRRVPATKESFTDLGVQGDTPRLSDLVFDGWVGLKDPVRPEVRSVFATMRQAGIRPIIITGDHPQTVRAVAAELGWHVPDQAIVTGLELDDLMPEQLVHMVQRAQIFARVEPKHKVRIVQALKQSGEVVAMFGDGVNDAPALKAADIAVVVNSGTDIAKDTADLILLDDHFGVITSAIREGRVMFDNIRRIFLFLVSDSFSEVLIIALALVFGLPLPLTALQILFKNLIGDGFPNLALTVEDSPDGVMQRPPRPKSERIMNTDVRSMIAITTVASTATGLLGYVAALRLTGDVTTARTLCFAILAINPLLYVFSIRRLSQPVWRTDITSNKWLLASIGSSLAALLFVLYVPLLQEVFQVASLGLSHWGVIILSALVQLCIIEIAKLAWRQRFAPQPAVI